MMKPVEIMLSTRTPLWTGGVDGKSDRLHATGIIGSLRWWYEAIVRGMGGYVSDPITEEASKRSEFDTKAYEEAKRSGTSKEDALQVGLRPLCAVSYLFGATGWARLFRLQIVDAPTTPLHFRTSLSMNRNWLQRVFGGEAQNIDSLRVPFGDIHLRLVSRGHNADYVVEQVMLALRVATDYGGLGARLQHGFGQVELKLPDELEAINIGDIVQALARRLNMWERDGPENDIPFNLRYFVSQTYDVPQSRLSDFTGPRSHVGSAQKRNENGYLPCAFDLRYKGKGRWGMRRWLKEQKGWRSSDDPKQLGPLDELMGPRSQWGPKGNEKKIDDELRTAGRVFFGMPYHVQRDTYRIRVFGFAPPGLLTVEELDALCREYMDYALGVTPIRSVFGKNLLAITGGTSK
ncbi:MAG TPA: type III-B CRISPR module RAMP protein Cmr1 [Anaerolineae bacterium]|nr:type III-B CRISPR module RAMP protein Cmr1 [Anaerolineae bacterium]